MEHFFKDDFGVFFNDQRIGSELFIYESGYERCTPSKPYEYVPIDYYVIHYCISGEGNFRLNNEEYHITEGNIFMIPPNTPNKYYPVPDNPWMYRWVGINGTAAKALLDYCGLSKTNCVLDYEPDDNILQYFEEIYEACVKMEQLKAMGYLYFLFNILNKKMDYVYQKKLTSGEIYFNEILAYIHSNYFNDIKISDISIHMNIDRTYIFKLFKKYSNTNPQQYILNYRLDRACMLLRKSQLRVTDIGYSVGFNTSTYFTRQFSKHMGMTPMQYRKQFVYHEKEI